MSDNDLLIGGAAQETKGPQGSSGIQVPTEAVHVSVFGVFKEQKLNHDTALYEDEYVEQKFPVNRPKHTPDEDVAQFVWMKFLQQASLRTVGSGGEINFYPLDRFKRFSMTVGVVVGVTL